MTARRPQPSRQGGSSIIRLLKNLDARTAVMMALIVTYLWRFQDLSDILRPFRLAALASAAAIILLAFQPNARAVGKALRRPYVVLFILWTIWLGLGTAFGIDTRQSWVFWSDYHLKNGLMFLFVMSSLVTLGSIRLAVAAHLLGVAIITFYYVKQGFPTDWTPLAGVDRNDLALMFNLATPIVVFGALTEEDRRTRWMAWGLAGLVATSTILTQSRGGFLTVAVIVLYLSFRVRGVRFYKRFVPLGAFVLGIVLMPQNVKDRLETILETEEDYNRTEESGRVAIWKRGIQYMLDHPVLGVGIENFGTAEATLPVEARTIRWWRGYAPHNVFVQVGAESGVVGLVLFVSMIIAAIVSLNRTRGRLVRRKAPPTWILFADLVTACLLAFCVGGFFLSWAYSPFLLFLMALVAGYQFCEDQIAAIGKRRRIRVPTRGGTRSGRSGSPAGPGAGSRPATPLLGV